MARELSCPNCGGAHTLINPGITMLVCNFCQSVVYWGKDTALQLGEKSILPEKDTRLFMHATGKILNKSYEVVGHLSYDHGRGTWDEWYLQLDNGSVMWLSEDERTLSIEQPAKAATTLPIPSALLPGAPIALEGSSFTIREIGKAKCVGGEGQLPFTVLPGEVYPYADLASLDGSRFATLEYDEGENPRIFVGHVLSHDQITIVGDRPQSTAGAHEGQGIKCPNCQAPLEVNDKIDAQTQVCSYCGAQNDITGAEAKVLGVNPKMAPGFSFEIGQSGKFLGKNYEICGRIIHQDLEGYESYEYLLYNPDAGYIWLVEEDGHFLLNRPTKQLPAVDVFQLMPKNEVKIGPSTFKFYEAGGTRVKYVDGALPWICKVGDTYRYADLIDPPRQFGIESDGQELEAFIGNYLLPEDVFESFNSKDKPKTPKGIHPAQPFVRSTFTKLMISVGIIFAAINLCLAAWSYSAKGRPIFNQKITSDKYLKEAVSNPFTIGKEKIMKMVIAAPLRNSWLALDVALLNTKNSKVVGEASGDISYYSGVEGGESWSEGTRNKVLFLKAPPPGQYKLILRATGGRGNTTTPRGEPVTIKIVQGVMISRFFIIVFFLAILIPLFEFTRKTLFEGRRWSPVMMDSDDDWEDDS